MNLKKLAILLVVLLGGMAIYYNISTSDHAAIPDNPNGIAGAAGTTIQTK